MISQEIEIINKLGLHARAAAKFVSTAGQYSSAVNLTKGEQKINAKSIMGVMMLAAAKGTQLDLLVEGPDEIEAAEKLCDLIANRFDEEC